MSDDTNPCCEKMLKSKKEVLIDEIEKDPKKFGDKIGTKEWEEILKKMDKDCDGTGPDKPTGPDKSDDDDTVPPVPPGATGDCTDIKCYYVVRYFIKTLNNMINIDKKDEDTNNKMYNLLKSIKNTFNYYETIYNNYYYNEKLKKYIDTLNLKDNDKTRESQTALNDFLLDLNKNNGMSEGYIKPNLSDINRDFKIVYANKESKSNLNVFNTILNRFCNDVMKQKYKGIKMLQAFYNQTIGGDKYFTNLIIHIQKTYYIEGFYLDKNNQYNKIFNGNSMINIKNSKNENIIEFIKNTFLKDIDASKYDGLDLNKIAEEIKNKDSNKFDEFDKMIKVIQDLPKTGAYGSRKLPKKISIKKRRSLRKRSLRKRSIKKRRSLRKRSLRKRSLKKGFKKNH